MTQVRETKNKAGAVYASAFLLSDGEIETVNGFTQGDGRSQVGTPFSDSVVKTRALLFYEGKHTDGLGRTSAFNKGKLEKIVAATNEWLAEGRRIKLYASDADHLKISQSSVIGFLESGLSLEEITAENLPSGSSDGLIGKVGIFAMVAIAGNDNVAQYKDGRLRELSIGLRGDRILEVSAVGVPALAGAALFSEALFPEDFFSLNLNQALEEMRVERMEQSLFEVFAAFERVLRDIRDATPEQLDGQSPEELRAIAVDDLATQLRGRLGVRTTQPIPMFSQEIPMPDETVDEQQRSAFALQLEQFQQERQQFARERATFSQYTSLKQRGQALLEAGKLTPAEFKQYFADDGKAIAHFSMVEHHGELEKLAFHFEQLEKHGVAATFGSHLKDEPLDGGKDEQYDFSWHRPKTVK